MQALRQYHIVQGKTLTVHLPEEFTAERVEVIILASENEQDLAANGAVHSFDEENTGAEMTLEERRKSWVERGIWPPPVLPVWTEEERQETLALLRNGPVMSEEDIVRWEQDIEDFWSHKSSNWGVDE
jgi:hypothetical protein